MKKNGSETRAKRLTEGNAMTAILSLAVPMIISNLFLQFYNVADTLIVGKYLGTDSLAAVGSAGSITAVFVQLASGLALGGSVIVSQYFGGEKNDKIRICTQTLNIFMGILGAVFTAAMIIFARPVLILVNTPENVLNLAVKYLQWYFVGCIGIFIYNALNSIYIALGDSKTPLKFLIISSIVNIILDLLFIIVFKWEVMGAAFATAISQFLAAAMAIIDLPKLMSGFERNRDEPIFSKKILMIMLKFAIPSALQQSVVSVGSVVVQATVNSFGSVVMAGSAAASKVINLATAIPINYGNAYSNYVGQNMGAGRAERIWPGLKASLINCGVIMLIMTLVFELWPEGIIQMFLQESETNIDQVIKVGSAYIRVVGAFLIVFSSYMLIKATFKGSGDMGWFIFVTLLSFFIRLFLTVGFARTAGVGIIWWAFSAGWVVAFMVAIGRYMQGGWKKKRIV